jgi:outer membrane protein insertion porin family
MMFRKCSPLVSALLLVVGATLLPAAEIVRVIRVDNQGDGNVSAGYVQAHISQQVGEELQRALVARDVKALLGTGRFTDVSASAVILTNGVELVFQVRNRYRLVEPPTVIGAKGLSASTVRDLLGLEGGDYLDDPLVAARITQVLEEYRKKLYPDIKVEGRLEVLDPAIGTARLTLRIDEGVRRGVRSYRFPGRVGVDEAALRKAMELPASWNPFYWFRRQPVDPDQIDAGRDRMRGVYVNHGYLDAKIGVAQITDQAPGKLRVEIPIDEGLLYRVGAIGITGAKLYGEAELQSVLKLKRDDRASGETLFAAAQLIDDYYESRGYMETYVSPLLERAKEPGVVDVTFKVREGVLTRIRNIQIRGNDRTQDKVMRRELLIYPDEVFDGVRVKRSENRLRNLNYFEVVEAYPEPTGQEGESDLIFQIEEKRTGQFMVGAGFSSVDNLIGFAEVSQGNFDIKGWPFVGGGQKLKFRTEVGSTREDYSISFIEPWFMDRRLALSLDLYSTERDYDDYQVKKLGTAVGLGMGLGGPYRLDFKYRLERSEINDASDTNAYVDADGDLFYFNQQDLTLSSLSTTLSRDTRNNAFLPSSGSRQTLSATGYGGPLGFDADLYSLEGSTAWYLPLPFKHVLALRLRAEVIDAYGDTEDVPLSERLFIGGARTIRGFKYRDVGPKAYRADGTHPDSPKPSGGSSLGLASAEYSIPIVSKLRLAAFIDAGNVWYDPYEFDLNEYAAGAGLGIRFDVPYFPIRLDYAWDLKKDDPMTETDQWSFSIGYGF